MEKKHFDCDIFIAFQRRDTLQNITYGTLYFGSRAESSEMTCPDRPLHSAKADIERQMETRDYFDHHPPQIDYDKFY